MDRETKNALERAGLQLVETGEVIKEIADILGAEVVDLKPHVELLRGRRCERCGSPKPQGQSCGCFDNGGQ